MGDIQIKGYLAVSNILSSRFTLNTPLAPLRPTTTEVDIYKSFCLVSDDEIVLNGDVTSPSHKIWRWKRNSSGNSWNETSIDLFNEELIMQSCDYEAGV